MNSRFRTLFFAALCFCGGVSAEARALKCDAIFNPSIKDVLETIDSENNHFVFQGKSFDEFSQNLSWLRKRKIRKLVQDIELRGLPSEKALERYAVELNTALFGSKEIVDRWIFKNKDQRLEESTVNLIKEQLLKEGLLKTWNDTHHPSQISMLKKTMDRIWTLHNSRIGQLTRLPFILPTLKNSQVPPELMYKIIRDGFNTHAEEVRVVLRKQSKIEAYNTFRRIYSPVFLGLMLIVNIQHAYAELERQMEQQVQETVNELRQQRETLEKNIPLVKQEILKTAYDRAIQEFIEKWGEPPTPEEQAILKAKIEKALNMN